jgi:hypothetical protein
MAISFRLLLFLALFLSALQSTPLQAMKEASLKRETGTETSLPRERSATEITEDEFFEIKGISENLLKLCPPESCVLIGVGTSPTPFMAYLHGLGLNSYAKTVPISDFRFGANSNGRPKLASALEEKLYEHFDHFLPKAEELKEKSVLVFDYAASGESLVTARNYLQSYLSKRAEGKGRISPSVKTAAIVYKNLIRDLPFSLNYLICLDSSEKEFVISKLSTKQYTKFSEFGQFNIQHSPEADSKGFAPRKEYWHLISELKGIRERKIVPLKAEGLIKDEPPALNFFIQERSGKLWALSEAKAKGEVGQYIHQLQYYQGPDLEEKYLELLRDPATHSELLKSWSKITSPTLRKELLEKAIKEEKIIDLIHLTNSGEIHYEASHSAETLDMRQKAQKLVTHKLGNYESLDALLKSSDPATRPLIVSRIPFVTDPRIRNEIFKMAINDPDPQVRIHAANLAVNFKDSTQFEEFLFKAIHNEIDEVRAIGVRNISTVCPDNHALQGYLMTALKDQSEAVRIEAVYPLKARNLIYPETLNALSEAAPTFSNPYYKSAVSKYLKEFREILEKKTEKSEPTVEREDIPPSLKQHSEMLSFPRHHKPLGEGLVKSPKTHSLKSDLSPSPDRR